MTPKGFWSYARGDDDHLDGMLSNLRKAIAGEVSMLMGEDVGIFQDIHDLRTGDRWAEKLRAELSAASFLIPVLTPRFFKRDWCREEVLTYLRLSQELGLEPRIFPIRFVKWDDDESCEVRLALKPFQYKDLSNWRFESDPTQKRRVQYEFAQDVKLRLQLPAGPKTARELATPTAAKPTAALPAQSATPGSPEATQPRQKVHIVDPWPKRGDFTSIQAAIDAAEPGDRIVVREGTYGESLRLSKVLEIIGEGDRERILVTTAKADTLHCDAPMARIAGSRFRAEAGGENVGIWINAGKAEIVDCVVESLALACVHMEGSGTAPTLRRCVLRDGAEGGLLVQEGAQPVAEDCTFTGHAQFGVQVEGRSTHATLRRSVAANNQLWGFLFFDSAGGVLEGCEANGNAYSGVQINGGATLLLRDCTLHDNRQPGIFIYEDGRGRVEGGRIVGNSGAGVVVQKASAFEANDCTISGNAGEAVRINDAASTGTFRNNDLRGNVMGAWHIAEGARIERFGNTE